MRAGPWRGVGGSGTAAGGRGWSLRVGGCAAPCGWGGRGWAGRQTWSMSPSGLPLHSGDPWPVGRRVFLFQSYLYWFCDDETGRVVFKRSSRAGHLKSCCFECLQVRRQRSGLFHQLRAEPWARDGPSAAGAQGAGQITSGAVWSRVWEEVGGRHRPPAPHPPPRAGWALTAVPAASHQSSYPGSLAGRPAR